jgi:UDP-N-acetyl-D-glucosamine dehydrogenase
MDLETKIREHTARVCVIGLGYVGLPLATEFAEAGYLVSGVDLDTARVEVLAAGRSYIADVAHERVAALIHAGRLTVTTRYESLAESPDAIFICVPTPYTALKVPDVS